MHLQSVTESGLKYIDQTPHAVTVKNKWKELHLHETLKVPPYHCTEWTSQYIYKKNKIITDLDSTPSTEHKYHFTTIKKHPHKWQSIYHILMVSLNNS